MNYIYKFFDEMTWAEEIIKRGKFPDYGTRKELKLICKYYRKQIAEEIGMSLEDINKDYRKMKEISREVEKRVIKFCEKATERFNYVGHFQTIQRAVRLSEKFYAYENDPIPITVNEWETIQSLEDEDAKKILFMKVVDAKYTIWHRKTIGRHNYNDGEYFNREGITQEMYCREMKVTRKNFRKSLKILRQEGMIEFKDIFSEKFGLKCLDKVMIIEDDLDAPTQDWITDYHNLLLHYERLMGANIGTCKKCGRLFRQSDGRNKYKFCEEHRVSNQKKNEFEIEYKKMAKIQDDEPERRLCFRCYTRFEVSKRGNTSQQIFCKKCQSEINKQKKAEYETCFFEASFNIDKIKIGDVLVGMELTMQTNKPFGYGQEQRVSWIVSDTTKTYLLSDVSDEIGYIYPDITISINANGDLTLYNEMENCTMVIKNCTIGEVITIDGENQIITSSLNSHHIYDDFNFEFFRIGNTINNRNNRISCSLPCKLEFRYKPIIKDTP